MAIRSSILVFATLMCFGCCLREHHQHGTVARNVVNTLEGNVESNVGDLESNSNETRASKCCCYQPVGDLVFTNPWGSQCPVKGARVSRGCARPRKASPCAIGPNKYDMYCEWYYALDCNSKFRNAENIMWNKAWQGRYNNWFRR